MTDRELKKLNRAELLQLLIELSDENEQLRAQTEQQQSQIESLTQQMDKRSLQMEQTGSIAEAAIRVNGVFEAAQAAADEYLQTIREMNEKKDENVPVDENGLASFKHLGAGVYTLIETVTPKGYNTCDPIEFEIVFDADAKTFHIKNENELGVDVGTSMTLVVENVPGTVLPTTGGMGTTLFYVIGGLLVFGAAVLLITKKRMKAEK